MRKITTISLNRAQKGELSTIVSGTLDIVSSNNPEALKIDEFYKKLLDKYRQDYLQQQKQEKKLLSPDQKEGREQRKNLIIAICRQTEAVYKADMADQRAAMALVRPVVNMHLTNLTRKKLSTIHDEVMKFTTKMKESDELMAAAETTGIKVYVTSLVEVEESLSAGTHSQVEESSKRRVLPLMDVNVTGQVINAFNRLLTAIELARDVHPGINYYPLIAQLNEFLVPYEAVIKARSTRSKNTAEKTKTVAMSATTSATAV